MKLTQRPTARLLPARSAPPTAIVVHASGQTDPTKTVAWYTSASGLGPHVLVTESGELVQFAPFDRVAWHAAYSRDALAAYARGWREWSKLALVGGKIVSIEDRSRYAEWRSRWPAVESPVEILGPKPNYASIGVELQSLVTPTSSLFSDAQYEALSAFLSSARSLVGVSGRVVGHSDLDPLSRWSRHGSNDPGSRFDWSRALKGTPWEG